MDASFVLKDFFGRSRIPPIIYRLKFRSFFFRMIHKEKFYIKSSVKSWTFLESPTWSDLFPLRS